MNLSALGTHLDTLGFETMRLLLATLWHSALLFTAVAALAWLLRKRRAAVQCFLWIIALGLAPFLPLLASLATSAHAPQAPIRVLPEYEARAIVWEPPPVLAPTERPQKPVRVPGAKPIAVEHPAPARSPPPFSPLDYSWALLPVAYIGVLLLFVLRFLSGHIRIFLWIRSARPLKSVRER